MNEKDSDNRLIYLDVLRIIASFAVIFLHVSAQNWRKADIDSFEWQVFNFYDSMARWGAPVFVMISGALFLGCSHSVKKIYKKNVFRIITAFFFWSFIYAFILLIKGNGKAVVIDNFFQGSYHMWFLFMITGLYIIVPFLKQIVDSDYLTKYFMLLSLVFAFIIPQVIDILFVVSEGVGLFIQGIVTKINLHFVLGYSGYFVLGYYLNRLVINKKLTRIFYWGGVCGFISTVVFSVAASLYTNEPSAVFHDYFTINVLFESIFIFTVGKQYFAHMKVKDGYIKIVCLLSKYSFGAYLVHVLVIDILNNAFHFNTMSLNAVVSVPLISMLVFSLSLLLSAVLNCIPLLNKYVV